MSNRLSLFDFEVEALHIFWLETTRNNAWRLLIFTHSFPHTPNLVAQQFTDSGAAVKVPPLTVSVNHKQTHVFQSQVRLSSELLTVVPYFEEDELSKLLSRNATADLDMLAVKREFSNRRSVL
jgi:hypothetical protein